MLGGWPSRFGVRSGTGSPGTPPGAGSIGARSMAGGCAVPPCGGCTAGASSGGRAGRPHGRLRPEPSQDCDSAAPEPGPRRGRLWERPGRAQEVGPPGSPARTRRAIPPQRARPNVFARVVVPTRCRARRSPGGSPCEVRGDRVRWYRYRRRTRQQSRPPENRERGLWSRARSIPWKDRPSSPPWEPGMPSVAADTAGPSRSGLSDLALGVDLNLVERITT